MGLVGVVLQALVAPRFVVNLSVCGKCSCFIHSYCRISSASSRVKKLGARSYNSPTDNRKFPAAKLVLQESLANAKVSARQPCWSKTDFDVKLALEVFLGHSFCNQLQADKG